MTTEKKPNNETEMEKAASEANLDAAIGEPVLQIENNETGQKAEGEAESETLSPDILATMAVMGAAELTTSIYPFLHYSDELKNRAIEKITPLLDKYNVSSPFLNKWKLEIEAGMFFGGVIFSSYMQIQHFKASQSANVVNDDLTQSGAGGTS